MMAMAQIEVALPWRSGGKASTVIACPRGRSGAPRTPCTKRQVTSPNSDVDMPQPSRVSVYPARAIMNSRLRPSRAVSQPTLAIIIALPTMNPVITQAIWSGVAEKAPCIWGRATPTTVQVKS